MTDDELARVEGEIREAAEQVASRLSFLDSWPHDEDYKWARGIVASALRHQRAEGLRMAGCGGNCGRIVDEDGNQVHADPECPMALADRIERGEGRERDE